MFGETPIVCFGEDGPAFERVCPKCRRFLKFPEHIEWYEGVNGLAIFTTAIECGRCGPVDLGQLHVGWAGDFR